MGWSSYLSYRLMTAIRGQLTSIIYTKMLTLPAAEASDSSAMSLMGTDVQKITDTFFSFVIDVVPDGLQVIVSVYLMYLQLGAVCVAPVLITISRCLARTLRGRIFDGLADCQFTVTTGLSVTIAGHITSRQATWLAAVERRINFTSEILGSMRSVKMLGLEAQMSTHIEDLRTTEITSSKRYRRVQCLLIALGKKDGPGHNRLPYSLEVHHRL